MKSIERNLILDQQFYCLNRNRFLAAFDKTRLAVSGYASKRLTPEIANDIGNEAVRVFEKILPELPYVGGDTHPGTRFIVNAGQWIAVYKAMERRGYQAIEVGHLMYSFYEDELKKIPQNELIKQKALTFSDDYINLMKQWAESMSPYECDWKANFVEGDGIEFEYGFDYRACPCFELFKAHDAKRLAPFFCLLDFPEAKQLNSGFFRTKTIAQGDEICNFRYKKGKEVIQSWDTEVERILAKQNQSVDNK